MTLARHIPHAKPACWHRATIHALQKATALHGARLPTPLRRRPAAWTAARLGVRRCASCSTVPSSSAARLGAAALSLLAGIQRTSDQLRPAARWPGCSRCHVCRSSGGGGSGGAAGGDDGGGEGSAAGGAAVAALVAAPSAGLKEDVILLDVMGMRCAGCVSRVKVLLERQQAVQAASVNLATETAVVRVLLPEPGVSASTATDGAAAAAAAAADLEAGLLLPSHEGQLESMGVGLARMLTDAGYAATMRQQGGGSSAAGKVVQAKREERLRRLK